MTSDELQAIRIHNCGREALLDSNLVAGVQVTSLITADDTPIRAKDRVLRIAEDDEWVVVRFKGISTRWMHVRELQWLGPRKKVT